MMREKPQRFLLVTGFSLQRIRLRRIFPRLATTDLATNHTLLLPAISWGLHLQALRDESGRLGYAAGTDSDLL